MKQSCILFIFCFISMISTAQDSTKAYASVFERIMKEVSNFKIDTSTAPDDKLTQKIIELRKMNGVFNIDEAIQFKIGEDKQKKDITEEEAKGMSQFFTKGDGKKLLDNAMIWIYRKNFTLKEIKQMVKFYKSGAGKKLTQMHPVIIFQTLTAAQTIGENFKKQQASKSF